MKIDVLLGLQWGDEGKGKIVDVLTSKYDVVARFQGGPNAGHTLEFNNIKHVLHTIPSGIFHKNVKNVIGNGVVLDPIGFVKEIEATEKLGGNIKDGLYLSRKTHLILPTHKLLDAALEKSKGDEKIGSTLKGIGPTYTDKTSRNGLRIGDIENPYFKEKYFALRDKHIFTLNSMNFEFNIEQEEKEWFEAVEIIKTIKFVDSEYFINNVLKENKTVLAEGAQGSLLDVDFGTYPFVTSSNTLVAGVCAGLGVAPQSINKIFGVVKAYTTRVGAGPFPSELFDADGELMRVKGHEFGATTGRKRRCGWLDLVALKYSIMLNGVTDLFLMKADVLDEFETIKVCTGYKVNGEIIDTFPYDLAQIEEPIYTELPGWKTDITKINKEEIPENLKAYIKFIEKETGVKVSILSTGPNRTQTIFLD